MNRIQIIEKITLQKSYLLILQQHSNLKIQPLRPLFTTHIINIEVFSIKKNALKYKLVNYNKIPKEIQKFLQESMNIYFEYIYIYT